MPAWINRENAAILLAAISFTLSLVAFWRQNRATGRAHFTAEWDDHSHIVFTNHGPGPAREVLSLLNGETSEDEGAVPYVGALQRIRMLHVANPNHPAGTLRIEWSDNRRGRQSIDIRMAAPPRYEWPAQQPHGSAVDATVRAIVKAEIDDAFRRATRGY